MRIFTRLLLAVILLAVYITGYSANLAYGITNDGVFIPKNSSEATVNAAVWVEKPAARLVNSAFITNFNLVVLNKSLSKTLELPKRYAYSFTANSSGTSLLGANLLSASIASWDDGRLKPTLSAYPNPSRGIVKVKLDQTGNDIYKIAFSNTIGRVLKTIKVPEAARDSEIKVDLSELPSGVYFYSLLVNDKMVETKRLIIQ